MRRSLLVVAVLVATAGCSARGDDPFAYARKPLYASGFDLAEGSVEQEFRVEDGSIGRMVARIWVNATSGTVRVSLVDPSGREMLQTAGTTTQELPADLGTWRVAIQASPDAAGSVSLQVTRLRAPT